MKIHFEGAIVDETLYFVEDRAKVNISPHYTNPIPFTGENKKNILIIYKNANHLALSDEQMQTLLKLVNAIQCTFSDIALVNNADAQAATYVAYKNQFKPNIILLFGLTTTELRLHINASKYNEIQFEGVHILMCDGIDELNESTKKQLWLALKKLFNL